MNIRQTGNHPGKLFILAILSATMLLTASFPSDAASPQPQEITEKMSCAACGMYPYHYPQWQSQVIFADGTMSAFDGCKCMFRFLFNMQKFAPGRKAEQVAAVWVKDFKSGKWIDGKAAHYVIGSKEMGPMGKELIPFATSESAKDFQKVNGGSIAKYGEIGMDTIKPLMGGMMHMKMPGGSMH